MERKQLIIIGSIVGGIVVIALIGLVIFLRIRATADLQPITTVNTPSGPAVQIPGTTPTTPERDRLIEQERERLAAMPRDTDGDGLSDEQEVQIGSNINDGDTDDDGYNDAQEVNDLKTDPTKPDTGGEQKRIDELTRRLSTASSTRPEPNPTPTPTPSPTPAPTSSPDADGDGLTAEQEANVGTNPNNADSDSDGLNDREEVETYKTDPLKADTDADT